MDILFVILGLGLAVYGAQLLVDGGSAVAKRFNIPTLVIGSTVVAFGTSMPEFTVNMHSALSGKTDLALGNILGSNLFNIFFTLGATSIIHPVPLDLGLNLAVIFNIAITFLLVMFAWFSKQKQMGRSIGGFLVASYVAYIVYALIS